MKYNKQEEKIKIYIIAVKHDIVTFGKEKVWEVIEETPDPKERMFLREIFRQVVAELENENEE